MPSVWYNLHACKAPWESGKKRVSTSAKRSIYSEWCRKGWRIHIPLEDPRSCTLAYFACKRGSSIHWTFHSLSYCIYANFLFNELFFFAIFFHFFSRSGRRGSFRILRGGGRRRLGLLGGKVLPPRPGNGRSDFLVPTKKKSDGSPNSGCSLNFFVPIIAEFGGRRETGKQTLFVV